MTGCAGPRSWLQITATAPVDGELRPTSCVYVLPKTEDESQVHMPSAGTAPKFVTIRSGNGGTMEASRRIFRDITTGGSRAKRR